MKKFLAVFTGSPGAMEKWGGADKETIQAKTKEGIQAWGNWTKKHSKNIKEMGGPLGKTKRVTEKGIVDMRNNLGAFTVVEAESQEAAAKMFLDHPHFTIFPGDGVEVMEILPVPGM